MASGGFLKFIQFWLNIIAPNLQIQVQWIMAHFLIPLGLLGASKLVMKGIYWISPSVGLNLNCVKDIHVVAEKMTRSGLKTAIYHLQILGNTLYTSTRAFICQYNE